MDLIRELMVDETAGDPISGLKWTHKTTEKIAAELRSLGIAVSARTVAKLLKKMGSSLRVNHQKRYPKTSQLGILADGGGSNGARCHLWQHALQRQLSERHGLYVTVAHYPPGASKWNPIEHRLFSEVSKNWADRPLDSYETILNHLRTTTTRPVFGCERTSSVRLIAKERRFRTPR